jgi:hypothetical protein
MPGPGLLEYNLASHLVWVVAGLILILALVIWLWDGLTDLLYAVRNWWHGRRGPLTHVDPAKGEGVHLKEPETTVRGRHFRHIVPVRRSWSQGRANDPLEHLDRKL